MLLQDSVPYANQIFENCVLFLWKREDKFHIWRYVEQSKGKLLFVLMCEYIFVNVIDNLQILNN